MTCPSEARLAAAVAGEDPEAATHAEGCRRCAAIVADGRAIRAALAALPSPSLRRRAEVLAEVLAEAERETVTSPAVAPRRPWRIGAVALGVAAMVTGAAAGVGAVRERVTARHGIAVEARRVAAAAPGPAPRGGAMPRSRAPVEVAPIDVAPVEVPPVEVPPVDLPPVDLPPVDASAAAPPPAAPSSRPAPPSGLRPPSSSTASPPRALPGPRVEQAPSASPPSDLPSPADPSLAPSSAPPTGVAAFQAGWEALRAGQPLVARAHFDRARDPAVAEDATYWAAVASERAGEPKDAARRYRSFAQAFPSSPRAADARAAAARLYDR
ncbi:MAG: hypothetical protein KBG48_00640 [Kofleriaceae bacterium]|nr:hypothetical protein [Kofleriaceae bacterium]MBP9165851.1 hypothetical protein [Kofleriaceae bacterium]